MKKYRVVAVESLKEPYEATLSFEEIQQLVGRYIEQIAIYDDKVALVNEDGDRLNLPPNRHMILQDKGHLPLLIVGNFVVVKNIGSDYRDLSDEEVKEAKYLYRNISADSTVFI